MDSMKKCAIRTMKKVALNNIQKAEERPNGWFIPFKNYRNSYGMVNGIVTSMENRVDKRYPEKVWGKQFYRTNWSDGIELTFNPSKKLVDAGKLAQKEIDRRKFNEGNPDVSLSQHGSDKKEEDTLSKSYTSLKEYKIKQLSYIDTELSRVRHRLKNKPSKELNSKLKSLIRTKEDIQGHIKALNTKEIDALIKVVNLDIEHVKAVLADNNIHSLSEIKKKIDFYRDFANGLRIVGIPDADLKKMNSDLKDAFLGDEAEVDKLIADKVKEVLINDYNVQEALTNLKDYSDPSVLRIRKAMVENGLLKEETDEITVDALLYRSKDINMMIENFATITDTFDNIIPSVIMSTINNYQNQELNYIIDLIEQLENIQEENPDMKVEDFLHEDGRLINVYTKEFAKALQERNLQLSYQDFLLVYFPTVQ
jgi:hypothetical protein